MVKTIELMNSGIGRLEGIEPILMPDKIEFNFVAKGYNLNYAFLQLRHGSKKGVFKLESPFTVPSEFLTGGLLHARVELYLGDKVAKRWDILPIRIYEVPTGTEIRDYLGELEEKIDELTEKVSKLEKQHEIIK